MVHENRDLSGGSHEAFKHQEVYQNLKKNLLKF
jgi:hypothetical protein